MDDLKSELAFNFKNVIVGLYTDPMDFDAESCYYAMKVSVRTFSHSNRQITFSTFIAFVHCLESLASFARQCKNIRQTASILTMFLSKVQLTLLSRQWIGAGTGLLRSKWMFELRHNIRKYVVTWLERSAWKKQAVFASLVAELRFCFRLILNSWWHCQLMGFLQGLGTNERVLVDVICTKTNCEIRQLKDRYRICE